MKPAPLPKRFFDGNIPVSRPTFFLKHKTGQTKMSAVLGTSALIVATTITLILIRLATS